MKKILIVDDNYMEREALSLWLDEENLKVIQAVDGQDGLNMARNEHPDLIISDITMPCLDGLGFFEELAKDKLLKNIPFIFLTGTSFPENIEKALKKNILLLAKPCNLERLTDIVKAKLELNKFY